MRYDWTTHGDFKRYYDTTQKRNYWVLGYFGGGSINILDAYNLAVQFAETIGVSLDTVRIDEILRSRRHKGFKFLFSNTTDQKPESHTKLIQMDDVYQWLTD